MTKRTIGGVGFVALFLLAIFTKFYYIFFIGVCAIALYEAVAIIRETKKPAYFIVSYLCLFYVSLYALYMITQNNPAQMLYFSVIIMVADTFAYLVGRTFGKHKLSKISPKKTIEGLIGGIVFGAIGSYILMLVISFVFEDSMVFFRVETLDNFEFVENKLILFIIVIIIILLSVVGDLLESSVKRYYNIKDSGFIVYGHGGILDRLDSWVLSGIFLYFVLYIIGV